jgi:hypothetical protein
MQVNSNIYVNKKKNSTIYIKSLTIQAKDHVV